VPSHRKPARRFQVVGAFVLVLGALGGSYSVLRPHFTAPAATAAVSASSLLADDTVSAEMALTRQRAQAKADAAASAAADKARQANEIAAKEAAAAQQAAQSPNPAVPASCDQYTGNRGLGCALLLQAGFGLDQMGCLDQMWTRESNWNPNSTNASSGAHGIPQALPADKMAPYGADYMTNPVPQIKWGLSYIKGRYGTPCGAWSFWQAHNYY
jgi:hypothetical protein